jgi:uncharacterized protein (DUF2147 family)
MKRRSLVRAALVLSALSSSEQPVAAAPIEGLWRNRNGTVDVRIARCEQKYCGTVVAAHG